MCSTILALETLSFALTACCTMCAPKIILSQDLALNKPKKTDGRSVQWIYLTEYLQCLFFHLGQKKKLFRGKLWFRDPFYLTNKRANEQLVHCPCAFSKWKYYTSTQIDKANDTLAFSAFSWRWQELQCVRSCCSETCCKHQPLRLVCEHTRGLGNVSLSRVITRGTAPYTKLKTLLKILTYQTESWQHCDMFTCMGWRGTIPFIDLFNRQIHFVV